MLPDNRNKKGTGFTNLGRILEASRGSRLGGQVASGVRQVAGDVKSEIGKAGQQFQTKAQEEAKKFGEEAAKERESIIQNIANPSSGSQGLQDNVFSKFEGWRSGEYKGPKQLEGYDVLSAKASEAEQLGQLGRTSGGKEELLKRFVGGRDYSKGERSLDAALLGLTGQKELSEAQRLSRGLTGDLVEQAGTASSAAKQLSQKAQQFGKETIEKLEDVRSPISESIRIRTKEAEKLEEERAKEYEKIKNLLASPDVEVLRTGVSSSDSTDPTKKLSNVDFAVENLLSSKYISPDQVQLLKNYAQTGQKYGLDVGQLISSGLVGASAKNIDQSTIASEEEKQRLSLIDRLMGKQAGDVGLKGLQTGYEKGSTTFDIEPLKKALEAEATRRNIALGQLIASSINPTNATGAVTAVASDVINNPGDFVMEGVNQTGTDLWREGVTNPVNTVVNAIQNPGATVGNVVNTITRPFRIKW